MAASHREMDATGRDPVKVRNLALSLLAMARVAEDIFSEWEQTFLADLVEISTETIGLTQKQRKEKKFSKDHAEAALALRDFRLTTRQAEKLFEIRDSVVLHRDISGVSIRNLINRCYEARLDLSEANEEWIVKLWKSGVSELRTGDGCRLECGWNSEWRIPGNMKLSFQAARSIG